MGLIRAGAIGRLPKEVERHSKRLKGLLAEPGVLDKVLTEAQARRPGAPEQVLAAAAQQEMAPDLAARLAVAKPLVLLLQRFHYEERGDIAALLLALDAEEPVWIEVMQQAAKLLQELLAATKEEIEEELYAYGVREAELPELEAEIQQVTERYL
jgi:hypothetical protein